MAEGLETADIFHWGQTWAGLGAGRDRKALGTRGHCPLAALEPQELSSSCSGVDSITVMGMGLGTSQFSSVSRTNCRRSHKAPGMTAWMEVNVKWRKAEGLGGAI